MIEYDCEFLYYSFQFCTLCLEHGSTFFKYTKTILVRPLSRTWNNLFKIHKIQYHDILNYAMCFLELFFRQVSSYNQHGNFFREYPG